MEDQWTAPDAQPPAEEPARRNLGRDTRIALTGIAIVLLVWFAVANFQDVKIRFWLTTTRSPLIVVIVISASLGAAASGLWSRRRRRRRSTRTSD